MEDLLYVVTVLVAFAGLVGFIRLCDQVVDAPDGGTSSAVEGEAHEVQGR